MYWICRGNLYRDNCEVLIETRKLTIFNLRYYRHIMFFSRMVALDKEIPLI